MLGWGRGKQHEPVWPSGKALGWKADDVGSSPRFGCPLFSKVVVCGHCVVTLPLTANQT